MKKIIALLATILTVSGCTLFSPTKDVDSLTGVLSKQDANDTYQGTHLLTEGSGSEIPLTSTALNLSSPQYLGNKVTVQGGLDEETGVFEVTGVTVLEVLEKEEGAAKWVEYMNQEVGFKLKYYDNWEVVDLIAEKNGIQFLAPSNSESGHDVVIVNKFDVTSDEVLKQVIGDNADSYFENDVKVGANQNSAKKYFIDDTEAELYLLTRDSFVYVITFSPYENIKAEDNKKVFYEMLSEFQFVPFAENKAEVSGEAGADETAIEEKPVEEGTAATPEDYSDYSEFESLPYKFKAKYPSDWYYAGTTGSGDTLHKYDFSDQPVTDENKFATLEVLSKEYTSGKKYIGNEVYFYIKVGDGTYSIHGAKDKEDILNKIASSITEVKADE
jgi:hypothetical protein